MSLPTRVLNFALITKLPHHHLPSLFHVHGVDVSPPARPRAAPSPLSPSLVLPKPLGLSTRRHLPTRTPRAAVAAPRRRTRRAVPCAASQLAAKPLPSPPPPQLSAQIASPSPRASPRPAHRLSLSGLTEPSVTGQTGPVRTGSGSVRYETGPNSKFEFEFKKMKNSQKILKILHGATNLMVSNFLKNSFNILFGHLKLNQKRKGKK